jgi:putative peptidoglycan lipid II flippase
VNKLLNKVNQRISLGGAATLLIAASLLGQILGFLRTKMVNANFAAVGNHTTDAYFAAFKIPDFFFFTLAAGALGVAFMPVLAEHMNRNDKKGMWELSSSLLNLLAIVMVVVGVVIFTFAEPLLRYIVAPTLAQRPEQLNDAVFIMRCVAFNPLLFTLSGILTSVQQTFGRFFFYAIAPLFYNASIIISIMIFSSAVGHSGGPGHLGLRGLGIGAAVGAVLQLLIVFLGMYSAGFRYRPVIKWKSSDFRLILRQLPPRSIDQGIDSINSIAETRFANNLGIGNISYYENAFTLHSVPTQLIGTTIATAAFPRLTERVAQGRPDLFRKDFLKVLRAMIWIAMPVVVVSFFARGYLARLIFSHNDAGQIALIFGYLVGAILFRIMYAIISRWFYAQKDTKTPLFVSLFTIALNIFLAYNLSRPVVNGSSYGIAGLAMAQSIVAAVEVLILVSIMVWRDHKLFNIAFWGGLVKILSVTGFSVLATFIMLSFFPLQLKDVGPITLGSKLAAIASVTFFVHITVSSLFGLEEAGIALRRIKKLILMPIKIQ